MHKAKKGVEPRQSAYPLRKDAGVPDNAIHEFQSDRALSILEQASISAGLISQDKTIRESLQLHPLHGTRLVSANFSVWAYRDGLRFSFSLLRLPTWTYAPFITPLSGETTAKVSSTDSVEYFLRREVILH